MEYSGLAGTNSHISKICLGTMTFGSPVPEKEAVDLIRYGAEELGINFVDTANMYEGYNRYAGSAGGVAEEIVGKAVKGQRDRYILATKVGMKVGDAPEDENTSPQAIAVQLRKSLQRMRTDYVDIFYLHRFDPETPPEEIVRALDKELRAGTIRTWGVSNYTAEQLKNLVAAAKAQGVALPALCQPALSMIERTALAELIPFCAEEGIGVVPYQILQGGLLTGKYKSGEVPPEGSRMAEKPEWMKPLSDEVLAAIKLCEEGAAKEGISMTAYALQFALRTTGVVSALIGVKTRAQLKAAAESL